MIEVVDISKSFDGKQILKDVSARFETGKTKSYYWSEWFRQDRAYEVGCGAAAP